MLNELVLIRNGIAELDDTLLHTTHKHLSEPGKTNVLRVSLAPGKTDGSIVDLDPLLGDKNKNYWTQGKGNKSQFPAVKLPFPLRPGGVAAYRTWKIENKTPTVKGLLSFMEELRQEHPLDLSKHKGWPDYRKELQQRATLYKEGLQGEATIVCELVETFLSIEDNGLALLRVLDDKLWQQCQGTADKSLLKMASLIMFADLGEKDNLNDKGLMPTRPTLLLDLTGENLYSAANKHWVPVISQALFDREREGKQHTGTCAISGKTNISLISDTFPAPKCRHIGNVIIYSRKKGVPTYVRYRKTGAYSMAVSSSLADEMASTLHYLNEKERGKTWDVLPGETGNGDLLLAFCRAFPDVEPARLLTHMGDPLDDEEDYELECEQICAMFKGREPSLMAQVDFLIIRKVSDGVQKAIFTSSQSLSNLELAAKNWIQASKNTPPIKLAFFKKGEKTPCIRLPVAISPKQFAMLYKKHYTQSINEKQPEVPGMPFAEVMRLFLGSKNDANSIRHLLSRLFRQFANLLEQAALKQTNPVKHHQEALYAITTMGLLLYMLGREKGVYMNELAFKLGQFCAALDEIHIGYCESERNGSIPSRLIGNQAYAAAISDPIKSLEMTAQRSAVYQAWARKKSLYQDSEIASQIEKKIDKGSGRNVDNAKHKIINAKYAYIWLHHHSQELHQLVAEKLTKASPESKAELLLGYLAGRPVVKKQEENKTEQSMESSGGTAHAN